MGQPSKTKKIFDGRYEIVGIVGRGSQSVVYRARHAMVPTSEVALKVLIQSGKSEKDNRTLNEKLRKEALAMVSARHKYVIRIDDFHSIENLCYLSMEFAEGGDLRQYAQKLGGRLPALQAQLFLQQAAEALQFIHTVGMIHRDIKPDNILVMTPKEIRIADFGVAVLPGEKFSMEELQSGVGTMDYMAPEVLQGIEYKEAADLYSLGVTFYELISGKHPFKEAALAQQLEVRKNVEDLRKLVPDVPEALSKIIMRAISFDREGRFGSARELVEVIKNPNGIPAQPARPAQKAAPSAPEAQVTAPLKAEIPPAAKPQSASQPPQAPISADVGKQKTASASEILKRLEKIRTGQDQARSQAAPSQTASTPPQRPPGPLPAQSSRPAPQPAAPVQRAAPMMGPPQRFTPPAAAQAPNEPAQSAPAEKAPAATVQNQVPPIAEPPTSTASTTIPAAPAQKEENPFLKAAATGAPSKPSSLAGSALGAPDEEQDEPIDFGSPGKPEPRKVNKPDIKKPIPSKVETKKGPQADRDASAKIRAAVKKVQNRKSTQSGEGGRRKKGILVVVGALIVAGLFFYSPSKIPLKKPAKVVDVEDDQDQGPNASMQNDGKTVPAEPDLTFPLLSGGIYSGTISGLFRSDEMPISILSLPNQEMVAVIVGIEGWTPQAISVSDLQSGDPLKVAANGVVLSFVADKENKGRISGQFKDLVHKKSGSWSVSKQGS